MIIVNCLLGLGIFFDTYSNTMQGNGQSITAMFGDGLLTYDHENDGTSSKVAGEMSNL